VRGLVPGVAYSVSATTRSARAGERDGVDYRFVSDARFRELIDQDAFLEWADVFGHRYGTPADAVAAAMAGGRDVILEIDVQGAAQIRRHAPGAILIFLAPPSREELERRLRGRRTEPEADLERRLADADREMEASAWFDHVVVNDDVERAAREVADIIWVSH